MDDYGIPAHIFGAVDEAFYAAVGRVPMLAALLEERLFDLLNAFHLEHANASGGKPGTVLTASIVKLLPQLPVAAEGETYSLRGEVSSLLTDADAVLVQRHDIVHSVFSNPTLESAFAWRTLPKSKRPTPAELVKTFTSNQQALQTVCTEMVRVIDTIGRLLPQVEFEKMKRLNAK